VAGGTSSIMAAWDVLGSVVEYETGWYVGGYDRVEQPDGSTKRYYWAALPPAVVVVAITPAAEVVFVDQYRPTIRETQAELPAGIVEDGETYAEAGARELREETGYDPDDVATLRSYAVATGVLRHDRGIVVAEGLSETAVDRDPNEFLDVRTVPAGTAVEEALTPPTNDATLEGVLLAERNGYL
jgi:ADP-ribose pyrophosphatase